MGEPHRRYPVIHVAGTKGKGSVAVYLATILTRAGYRVGLYTSPHLVTVRERIRIDGRMISREDFARFYRRLNDLPVEYRIGSKAAFRTVFEHLTALALLYFAAKKVDAAVVEAGLGGRLDTTIVVEPVVSVVTPIGLDHMLILGDTIPQIAWEKSFVIKPGIPVVLSVQTPAARQVLEARANEVGAPLFQAPGRTEFQDIREGLSGSRFKSSRGGLRNFLLRTPLVGDYQLGNISTTLTVVDVLRSLGWIITDEAVAMGLRRVRWPGRLQVLSRKPLIIIDGAHNTLSATAAKQALEKLCPGQKWRVVFAVMKNKQYPDMIEELKTVADKFYFCPLQFPKSWTEDIAREMLPRLTAAGEWFPDAVSAYLRALKDCASNGRMLAVGSLYLAGEILRHRQGLPPPTADGRLDART